MGNGDCTSGMAILRKRSKRTLFIFAAAAFVSLCAIIMTAAAEKLPVIIIDAGHGGEDGGAVGISGTLEKNLNLKAAHFLREYFENSGFEVIMTRTEDDDTDGSSGFSKKDDIYGRKKTADGCTNAIFLSVHMNSSGSSRDKGFQVFYGSENPSSIKLAGCIYDCVGESALVTRLREVKASPDTVYLMKNITLPCVLIECGFISNSADEGLLTDDEYLRNLAYALYCGVEEFVILNTGVLNTENGVVK